MDHLTFEGEGGRIDWYKKIFSHWPVVQAIFLELCMDFFYSHSCCMVFVLTVKALQKFLFSNLPSPPPKDQMVHLLDHDARSFLLFVVSGFHGLRGYGIKIQN